MPKKRADEIVETQMVRIDQRLWESMKREGLLHDRSPRQEIEHRLRQSLGETMSWGRALGRLVHMLADDVERYSHRPEEALAKMQAAAPALFEILADHIRSAVKQDKRELSEEERAWAVSQAVSLAGRVKRAHLTKMRMEELAPTNPQTKEEREREMLQEALLLSPRALERMKSQPIDQARRGKKQ